MGIELMSMVKRLLARKYTKVSLKVHSNSTRRHRTSVSTFLVAELPMYSPYSFHFVTRVFAFYKPMCPQSHASRAAMSTVISERTRKRRMTLNRRISLNACIKGSMSANSDVTMPINRWWCCVSNVESEWCILV